jgi:hypothetical protein
LRNSRTGRRLAGSSRTGLAAVRRGDALDLLAGLLAAGLLALVYAGRPGLARLLLTLGFTFFAPGRAIVTNWPLLDGWSAAAMSIVLSLTALTLLATTTLWAHIWQPAALFQAEAWLSLACLAAAAVRRHRAGRAASEPSHDAR